MVAPALLVVESLCYAYGPRRAVQNVSFQVHQGQVFGLLGPNGAGKTTTIQCIAGLKSQWQGEMKMGQLPFRPADDAACRKRLGFVPQELALYEGLTARENLSLFGKLAGVRGKELTDAVEQSLDLAGLSDRGKDLVKTFSGGMKRRLNLAIGQVHRPDLLLLDEPTVGVDPQSRNHLFDTLEKLKSSGMTMIYTTHYMEEAERLCDSIAIMNEGQMVATGSKQELATSIAQPQANLETIFLQLTGRRLRDDQ